MSSAITSGLKFAANAKPIAYADDKFVVLVRNVKLDMASRVGVFSSVRQQVGDHLRKTHGVNLDRDRLRWQMHTEVVMACINRRPRSLNCAIDDHLQRDRRDSQIQLAARDVRCIQKIIEQQHAPGAGSCRWMTSPLQRSCASVAFDIPAIFAAW